MTPFQQSTAIAVEKALKGFNPASDSTLVEGIDPFWVKIDVHVTPGTRFLVKKEVRVDRRETWNTGGFARFLRMTTGQLVSLVL